MTVSVDWTVDARPLRDAEVCAAAQAAAAHGGQPDLALSIVLVDEPYLTDLHSRFLQDPTPTDVISFDLGPGPGPQGEVYVSVDRAQEVVQARGGSVQAEIALYVVHGVLHLCGFDDRNGEDRKAMRAAERSVLSGLGYTQGTDGERGWPSVHTN